MSARWHGLQQLAGLRRCWLAPPRLRLSPHGAPTQVSIANRPWRGTTSINVLPRQKGVCQEFKRRPSREGRPQTPDVLCASGITGTNKLCSALTPSHNAARHMQSTTCDNASQQHGCCNDTLGGCGGWPAMGCSEPTAAMSALQWRLGAGGGESDRAPRLQTLLNI